MNEEERALGVSFADALRLVGMRLGDRALAGPSTVQIDLTDDCNNNCIGCWARSPFLHAMDDYDGLPKGSLELPVVVDLLNQLAELDVREIFLGGGGEPLCHPDALEVIRQAKARGFRVVLNTNMTLADGETLLQMSQIGLDHLIASLWAGTGTTYAVIHPNKSTRTFDRICDALIELKDAKKWRGVRLPVVKIYNVLCSLNYAEIPQMVEAAHKLGAEEMELAVFDPIPGRTGHLILNREQIDHVRKTVQELEVPEGLTLHKDLLMDRLGNVDVAKGVYDNGLIGEVPCSAGWFYARVTTTGQVHSCLKSHRIPLGEISENPFEAIWFGDKQDEFRRNTARLDYENPYLQKIGHDINFALPGCFRICDNLGASRAVKQMADGLPEITKGMLEEMERAAREGGASGTVDALRGIFDHFSTVALGDERVESAGIGVPDEKLEIDAGTLVDIGERLLAGPPDLSVEKPGEALKSYADELVRRAGAAGLGAVVGDEIYELAGMLDEKIDAGADRHDLLRGVGAVLGSVHAGPYTLHLDLSNRCNSDCRYCWFHSPLSADRTDPYRLQGEQADALLDMDIFRRLLRDLDRLGMPGDVVLSGKGEPLLHGHIGQVLDALSSRGAFTTLLTGGLPLSGQAETLVDKGLGRLYVSLSAVDGEGYAALHDTANPGRDFERILEGVRKVQQLKSDSGSKTPELVMANVLCKTNADRLIDIARQAADLGADFLRLQLMAVEPYNSELRPTPDQMEQIRRDLPQAVSIAGDAGVTLMDNLSLQLESLSAGGSDWSEGTYKERPCLNGWYFSRVWADGLVSFCCIPRIVGDLKRTSFYDLWTGADYRRYRLAAREMGEKGGIRMLDGTPLYGPQCDRCPNYEMNERMERILEENGLGVFLKSAIGKR